MRARGLPAFEAEILTFERDVRVASIAAAKLLADRGLQLGQRFEPTAAGLSAALSAACGQDPSAYTAENQR